jgi:hypothetical protein
MLSNNSFSQSNPNVMQTFRCLLICSITHEDIFIVRVWMMFNTIAMLIFANYLLGMNENQTSISKSNTNNTPFVSIKTRKREKGNSQRENKNFTPNKKKLKDKDLDSKRYEEVYRPLMTFTKVFLLN